MYIHEAIKARTAEAPYITRGKWRDEFSGWRAADIKLQPTNSPDCCIVESKVNRSPLPWVAAHSGGPAGG